jgi:hypothetical protein
VDRGTCESSPVAYLDYHNTSLGTSTDEYSTLDCVYKKLFEVENMKPWEKYGLSEFWYNDLKLTGKKLKKEKIKTVSMDLAASNLREYLAKKNSDSNQVDED